MLLSDTVTPNLFCEMVFDRWGNLCRARMGDRGSESAMTVVGF
ncbi:hypothetical protein [Rhodohalobacter sp. SW132]|nr:hypothetical protein [Rhodohalobacter sp. SW132]